MKKSIEKERIYNYLDGNSYTVMFSNIDGVIRSLTIEKDNKIIRLMITSEDHDGLLTSLQFKDNDFDLILQCFTAILRFNYEEETVRNIIEENKNAKEESSSTAS